MSETTTLTNTPQQLKEKIYPKTKKENVLYRAKIAITSVNNLELQQSLKKMCEEDILFWVNTFVYGYDPRRVSDEDGPAGPFITYGYEDKLLLDLVNRIETQKDLLIDKSRDMGVTWSVLLTFVWFWLFKGQGYDFLVGSRKEQYIDVMGNMDTLLEKIRFVLRNQPRWLMPAGFQFNNHSNYLKIVNPESGNTITGEATNNNFSRGGRRRAIFFDEFAFWECDESAWRASADSSNCRIVVSTPCGFNNMFAKLRFSESIDVLSLHWTLHPDKNKEWYDSECKRRNYDKVQIAQELDISYESSEEGVLFSWDELRKAVKNFPVMSQDRLVVAIDPAGEGDDEAVIYVSNNGNIVERKFIARSDAMQLAAECVSLVKKYKAQVLIGDAIGNDVLVIAINLLGKEIDKVKVVAVKNSEKAQDPVKFYNKRAEIYHNASKMMQSGNVQLDDDYTLMKQLNATKYETKDGRIIIKKKEEIKQAIGSSPDRADAWVLSVEGLKYTHSRKEVEQKDNYRRTFVDEVRTGEEYGRWGDIIE